MSAIGSLFCKELIELKRNIAILVPVLIVTALSFALPFIVIVVIPAATGNTVGDDADLAKVSLVVGAHESLTVDGRVQLFLFQQFLMLFLLTPITGAMALAAHAIVGEKQARTLEPLLATPITTADLLVAKVLGTLVPTMAISIAGLAFYFLLMPIVAEPGVTREMLSARTFVLVFLVGPTAALVSLQTAIVVSSRVNDARTAQQFGALIIIPVTAVLVAQFTGSLWLSATTLAFVAVGLFGVWILLAVLSVAIFDREAILTRWS